MGDDLKDQTSLVRRGSRYYFRVRVPSELLGHYGKAEICRSLHTSDKTKALQLARLERLQLDQEFQHARALLPSSPEMDLSDLEVDRLAALWGAEVLSIDEHWRVSGMSADTYESLSNGFDVLDDELRSALALGNFKPIEHVMNVFLKAQGIQVAPESYTYKRLGYAFTKQALLDNKRLRARHGGEIVDTPHIEPPIIRTASSTQDNDTLEALFDYWKTQSDKRPRTIQEAQKAVDIFQEQHGHVPASHITRRHVVAFKDKLLEGGKAPATVSKQLNLLKTIFETAASNERLSNNPARGVKVPLPKTAAKSRVPFALDDLRALFDSEVFTQGTRPRGGKGEAAFWLPLLALWTGARMEELGQLLVEDVRKENGIWCLFITPDPSRGKVLKTASSRRRFPVHGELVRCGFLRYVETIKSAGASRLFPLMEERHEGRQRSASFSQWFGRYLRQVVKVQDARKVFHSFRHGFKDACRENGVPKEIHDRLTGHSGGDVGDNYGGEFFPLVPLFEGVSKINYTGLDLSHLHRPE